MGKSKNKNKKSTPTEKQEITEQESQYRILFDFAYYLENLSRGSVGGATQLLRLFLIDKGYIDENFNTI